METGRLDVILRMRVGIFVERVHVAFPTLAEGGGMGVILRRCGVCMVGVDVFNARGSIVTLNGSVAMYTTCLAVCMGPHGWPRESTWSGRSAHFV